jgi:type II secretory pathway component GspD/PulD (secretin)
MKTKILMTLTALALAGGTAPVFAQTVTNMPEESSNAPVTAEPVPPPDQAPDQTNPGGGPPNEFAPPETMVNGESPVNTGEAGPNISQPAPAQNQHAAPTVILPKAAPPRTVPNPFTPPPTSVSTNSEALRLNFNNAPLDMVLSYLSDAAGFIIVLDTPVSGNVSIVSTHPVTKDEAVNLLNAELNRNGYAAIRNGRILTIVNKNDAKTRNIPVKIGNDPALIPDNDEMATWIIPIRFVEARQLASDLSSFVSPQATVVANEAANSIVVTDTQSNIRHLAEIIQAVDNSAQSETEIRVFRLKYANPTDVASELSSIFPSSTSGNANQPQAPFQFRGPGGFFARMAAAAANANNSQNQRIQKATQVTAVADARLQAVIVSAPHDLMEQIAEMMTALDVPSERDQRVYVFHLDHGDPNEVAQVLQNAFGSSTATAGRGGAAAGTSAQSALQYREQQNANTIGNSAAATSANTGGRGGSTGSRFTGGGF